MFQLSKALIINELEYKMKHESKNTDGKIYVSKMPI